MSKYLNTICEFMHDDKASKSIETFSGNIFRMYMIKSNALAFEHNVKLNHTHEIIHITTDKCISDVPIYEKSSKGIYGNRGSGGKRTVYYVEFKFTELAFAFYENYDDWVNL